VDMIFKPETVTMFKMLSLHQGVERSYYDSDFAMWDNLPPLPEDFSGLSVVSCTPVLEEGQVLERLTMEQMSRRIAIVDGVQRLMMRKIQKDGNWVYLVGLAAGAVEVWPKADLLLPTLRRELILFVPEGSLELPFEDEYYGIPFRSVPYNPRDERRPLNNIVSEKRSALELSALNQAVTELGGQGILLRDGPLKFGDPLTRANGPVGLVKTLEPRSNVDIFTSFVKKLAFGQVSSLLEMEDKKDQEETGKRRYFAYLRIMDVGDPTSLEGVVRLDLVGPEGSGEELARVVLLAAETVFSLSRVGPYARSPYNLMTVEWLEKHLRALLPDPSVLSIEVAREVTKLGR